MRTPALFLVLALHGASVAQVHVPLFNEPTRMWTSSFGGTVDAYCSDTWTTTFWLAGDTLINDTLYTKVVSRGFYQQGYITAPLGECTTSYYYNGQTRFVREVERKVYARMGTMSERLIYDFTAEVGDTIPFPNYLEDHQWGVVSEIDSVEVNGTYRKRFIIPEIPGVGNGTPEVIEGIGGCRGPFQELYGQVGLSHGTGLDCVVEHGVPIYGGTVCPIYSHVPLRTGVAEIRVAPNPSTGAFTISGTDAHVRFEVLDHLGAALLTGHGERLDLGNHPPGLYMLRLWSANGTFLGSHRLVVAF